jgi:tetratricopeptide (TPR) repeat protein
MDEYELHSLVSEGENERIDFKVELHLDSAQERAEFIKDVIALANSTQNIGYLLVGVDDAKVIRGCSHLEEERIQEIVATYITPVVKVKCFLVPCTTPNLALVGVIEIHPTRRPYQVARATERLNQNDVFIRRGTVIAKASPEELFQMREDHQYLLQMQQYIKAAEIHASLGNLDLALRAYSSAIEMAPIYALFYARGKLRERIMEEKPVHQQVAEQEMIIKDYSDALALAETDDQQKQVRAARFYLDHNQEDFEWLKKHTYDRERGEILFTYLWGIRQTSFLSAKYHNYPEGYFVERIEEIIKLGYTEPIVYLARAEAHCFDHNAGLALRDIRYAIEKGANKEDCHSMERIILQCIEVIDRMM